MDAAILLCCAFGVSILLVYCLSGLASYYVSVVTVMAATLVTCVIGAAAGLKQICWQRALIVLVAVASACSAIAYFETAKGPTDYYLRSLQGVIYRNLHVHILILPLMGLAVFLFSFLTRLIMDQISQVISKLSNTPRLRYKALIGLAIGMFIVHQVIQLCNFEKHPVLVVLIVLTPWVFAYFLSQTFTARWNWLMVMLCLLAVGTLLIPMLSDRNSFWPWCIAVSALIAALFAAGSGISRIKPAKLQELPLSENSRPRWARVSVWVTVPLLVALSLVFTPRYVHLPALLFSGSPLSFLERLEEARAIANFERKTESRFSRDYHGTAGVFEFDFAGYSSPTALQKLDQLLNNEDNPQLDWRPWLKNLHPGVQTKMTSGNKMMMAIEGGTITGDQFQDLADSSLAMSLSDLEIVSRTPVKIDLNQVFVHSFNSDQLQKLFQSIDPESSIKMIYIQSELTAESWLTVAEASRHFSVHHFIEGSSEAWKALPNLPSKRIILRFHGAPTLTDLLQTPAFCDSDISLTGSLAFERFQPLDSLLEAKLLLRGLESDILGTSSKFYETVDDWREDKRLVFERDENGNPLALLCPLPITDLNFPTKGLEHLKTLTLDLGWIEPNYWRAELAWRRLRLPTEKLAELPSLERLALPCDVQIDDLDFLRNVPNLNHLQIGVLNFPEEEYAKLEGLSQLHELVLFDEPSEELLIVLAKLPKLRQLTIVVPDSFEFSNELQNSILKFLPDCLLTIELASDFRPNVPESFRTHFSNVIQELKEKLAGWNSDKPLQKNEALK
jgi:hypothetical protein